MQHQLKHQTTQDTEPSQNRNRTTIQIQNSQQIHNDSIPIETKLTNIFDCIKTSQQISQIVLLIKEYCEKVVSSDQQELFVSHIVQVKFLEVLLQKLHQFNYEPSLLRMTFCVIEILLQTIKKEQNMTFLLVTINKLGYISEKYEFRDQQDITYYGHFLKLLIVKIQKDERYISAFMNASVPHFPLILNLIKLANSAQQTMQTQSKLALIQICSNSKDIIEAYLVNFPFVIFYPLMVQEIADNLHKILQQKQDTEHMLIQHISNQIMYMEEFINDKDQISKDIYINTFLQTVGKKIYSLINHFNQQQPNRIKLLIKLLAQKVVPEISIDKIKNSFSLIFSPLTTVSIQNCLQRQPVQINSFSQILQQCMEDVITHCRTIFFEDSTDNQSIITTINSYIPWTKDNWLYYELKKISQLIGMQVALNQSLLHLYLSDSFLMALQTLYEDSRIVNPLFSTIINQKDEELLYWYLRLVDMILRGHNDCLSFFTSGELVKQLLNCNSLELILSFYNLLLHAPLKIQQSQIQSVYSQVTQRLIKYVMKKGWKELLFKAKSIKLKQKQEDLILRMHREIQCDILLFVCIRTNLGSSNDKCPILDAEDWTYKADISNQISFKCQTLQNDDQQLQFVIDGQYLHIRDEQGQNIHQEDLLLRNLQFHDGDSGILQIIGMNSDSWGITLHFRQQAKLFILKEIYLRKCLATRIELQLKSMHFQFSQ